MWACLACPAYSTRRSANSSRPMTNSVSRPNRPGRPPGPTEGRGHRPYDPRRTTPKRERIICAVHSYRREIDSGDIQLCEIASLTNTSPSYLSIVKNSPWGQAGCAFWIESRAALFAWWRRRPSATARCPSKRKGGPCRDGGVGEIDRCFAMPHRGKRVINIDPPTPPSAIMRRAQPLPRRE